MQFLKRLLSAMPDKAIESIAFAADKRKFDDRGGQNFKNSGYGRGFSQNGPNKFAGGRRTINHYCDHCQMHCHSMERSFKLKGYPPSYKVNQTVPTAKRFAIVLM